MKKTMTDTDQMIASAIKTNILCLPHIVGPLGAIEIIGDGDFDEAFHVQDDGIVFGRGFREFQGQARTHMEQGYMLAAAAVHVMMAHPSMGLAAAQGANPRQVDREAFELAAQTVVAWTIEESNRHPSGMFHRPRGMPDLTTRVAAALRLKPQAVRPLTTMELHDTILASLDAGASDDLLDLVATCPKVLDGSGHETCLPLLISQTLAALTDTRSSSSLFDDVARETGIAPAVDDGRASAQLTGLLDGTTEWSEIVHQMPVINAMMAWPTTIPQGRQALDLLLTIPPAPGIIERKHLHQAMLEMVITNVKRAGTKVQDISDAFGGEAMITAGDYVKKTPAYAPLIRLSEKDDVTPTPTTSLTMTRPVAKPRPVVRTTRTAAKRPTRAELGTAAHGRRTALKHEDVVIATITRWGSPIPKIEVALPKTVAALAASLRVTVAATEGGGETTLGEWLEMQSKAGATILHQR